MRSGGEERRPGQLALLLGLCLVACGIALWRGGARDHDEPPAPTGSPEPSNAQANRELALPELPEHDATTATREQATEAELDAAPVRKAGTAPVLSTIHGRVSDDAGAPVQEFAGRALHLGSSRPTGSEAHIEFASTGGTFSVAGLAPGEWSFSVYWQRRESVPVIALLPDDTGEVVLVLPRYGSIAGVVNGRGLGPLAYAQVFQRRLGEDLRGEEQVAMTDELGRFRIENVPPGAVELSARHGDLVGSASVEIVVDVAAGALTDGVELELGAGGRLEVVLDPELRRTGKPKVELWPMGVSSGSRSYHSGPVPRGILGGKGEWRTGILLRGDEATGTGNEPVFVGIVPGEYLVTLEHGLCTPKRATVRHDETTEVRFGVERSITVHGTVTGGAPGLCVRAEKHTGAPLILEPFEYETLSREGSVAVDGSYSLSVRGPGEYVFRIRGTARASFVVTLPDRDDVELDFALPGGGISGRVRDADGRTHAGVRLSLVRQEESEREFPERSWRDETDGDGRFHFSLLEPGTYTLRVNVIVDDRLPLTELTFSTGHHEPDPPPVGRIVVPDIDVGDTELTGLDLRLPAEGFLSGAVDDGRGSPVHARIRVLDAQGRSLTEDWLTDTDTAGAFRVGHLAPGRYTVLARSRDREGTSAPFVVREERTTSVRVSVR